MAQVTTTWGRPRVSREWLGANAVLCVQDLPPAAGRGRGRRRGGPRDLHPGCQAGWGVFMRIAFNQKSSAFCSPRAEVSCSRSCALSRALYQPGDPATPFPAPWLGGHRVTSRPQPTQRTVHTSRMQKRARQVGQGTRLASQVSGRRGSWRLANHLPMQVRHHMGRQ